LQTVGFDNEGLANQIGTFSVDRLAGSFFFLRSAAGLCVLFIAGVFAGKRAKLGGLFARPVACD